MEMWIVWIIIAAVLVIVEVLSQMVWTLCLAGGCFGALVASVSGADIPVQLIVLAVTAVVMYIVMLPWFRRWHDKVIAREGRNFRTGMDALLGRRATVVHEIKPGELGRARIDGDCWQVRAPGESTVIKHGDEVVVSGYDSIILTVERIK